jgi:hypothetical protein
LLEEKNVGLELLVAKMTKGVWGIFAHLQHEDMHSQNSLGSEIIM